MRSPAREQLINCTCHNDRAPARRSLGISNSVAFLHSGPEKGCHNRERELEGKNGVGAGRGGWNVAEERGLIELQLKCFI